MEEFGDEATRQVSVIVTWVMEGQFAVAARVLTYRPMFPPPK